MKLPVSDKVTKWVKPLIKKGYYPAVLLSVEPYLDQASGKLKIGKFGTQLIFEFAVFKANDEGTPTEPFRYAPNAEYPNELLDVTIAKFVYSTYKDKKTGDLQTAVTPNSAITKILKALGWEFSIESPDTDDFLGKWVEVNVDDYEYEDDEGKTITASTIKDINVYKGPTPKVEVPEKKENKAVQKQVKHESVPKTELVAKAPATEESPEVKEKREKIMQLEKMHAEGFLTKEGLETAKEQIEAQIQELMK